MSHFAGGSLAVIDPFVDQFLSKFLLFGLLVLAPTVKFYEMPEIRFELKASRNTVIKKAGDFSPNTLENSIMPCHLPVG